MERCYTLGPRRETPSEKSPGMAVEIFKNDAQQTAPCFCCAIILSLYTQRPGK